MPEPAAAEERNLVDRARAGDNDALAELYVRHVDRIHAFLAASVGNGHDAEDLTSQTFSRMLERIDRFEHRAAPFSAWLHRIAWNAAVDHFRAARRVRPEGEAPETHGTAPSAEEAAFATMANRRAVGLARTLSPDQRRVVALRLLLGRSTAEAAASLGRSEGAVKQLQHRALRSLARRLDD